MARKMADTQKTFNIAVVGLSGSEKEKGCMGTGKSCLCNRFVRPFADDYFPDHISVLSQSDFNGRVVNNDHWLYWGEVTKITDENVELQFSIVEQTEFLDDACFQPFKSGKSDPYYKRCAATRLCSGEKLMYICKNQLGIEKEYEQKYLPDGKFHVDGYVCVFDVSEIQGRSLEKNIEYTALILLNLLKTKKPIVFATTKRDEATELFVREAERLVNRKEFRGYIPLVETSAHEHVNVDLPFVVCAQLIDRTKGKAKIWTFQDALHFRKETLEYATDAFQSLVRMQVTDYRSAWHTSVKKLTPTAEYINYCDLFGQEAAHIAFKRHIKKLKEDYIARKLQMYLRILPEVLSELVPDAECIGENSDWITVKNLLKHHPDYDQYFLENPPHVLWYEVDLNETNDTRIPVDLLETPEAENYYYEHKRALESEDKRKEMRVQFRQLLRDTLYVTPGKLMTEVRVLFMGRECYESLSEQDIIEMYGEHQKEITDSAKANFQELLQEHSDIFSNFAHMGPGNVVTQEDIFKITEVISGDVRYKALDRIEQDRTLMLLRHLGFLHAPIREHCPAFPNCIDSLIDRFVETRIKRRSGICNGGWCATSSLNILILGAGGLGEELAIALKKVNESFILDQTRYALDFRIIEGDVDLPQNAFNTSDFSPQACICVYSNHQTLEYVRDSFEKALLSNLEEEERLALHGLPIVLLFAADPVLRDQEVGYFREEGENQAKSLQCPFVDVTPTDPFRGDNGMSTDSQSLGSGLSNEDHLERWFSEDSLRIALQALIENVQRKTGIYSQLANQLQKYDDVPEKALNPDLRLLMCFLCGDPFDVSSVIGLFICDQNYHVTAVNAIVIEAMVGDSKKTIELIFTSYHGAQAYRDELLHGFVLVYSAHRKASLSTLVAFSNNIPNTPTQILAVAENSQSTGAVLYSNDLPHQLVAEGNAFSDKIRGHFMTTTQSGQSRNTFCASFYQDVWERKPSIERAFDMESSEYSSEREAGSAHGRYLVDEDGERIYEQLPSDNAVSPYMEKRTPLSPGDDSDMYTSVISQQQSDDGEQLLKPSQLRNRRSLMPELCRQSLPSPDLLAGQPMNIERISVSSSRLPVVPPLPPANLLHDQDFSSSLYAMNVPLPPSQFMAPYANSRPLEHSHDALGTALHTSAADKMADSRAAVLSPAPCSSTGRRGSSNDSSRFKLAFQARKSYSLKSAHGAHLPNVPLPLPLLHDPRLTEYISDEMSEEGEEDTISSSGLSAYGAYPPPEPAPPDYPPHMLAVALQPAGHRSYQEGWSDNQIFKKNVRTNEDWLENDVYQSYQAEQQLYGSERAKLKPGKLNLKQFDNITDAVGRLNITQRQSGKSSSRSHISPDGYEQDFAKYGTNKQGHPAQKVRSMSRRKDNSLDKETESDSEERSSPECQDKAQLMGRPERRPGQPLRTRSRKKRSIPVAPPRLPFLEGASSSSTTSSSRFIAASQFSELEKDFQQKVLNTAPSSDKAKLKIDSSFSYIQSSLGDEFDVLPKESVARQLGVLLKSKSSSVVAESDKGKERKDKLDKKRQREEEKEEKRRLKEEERQKRLEEKKKKKSGKGSGQSGPCLEDFIQSEYNLTPLFVEMCIRFIEEEGLDSEGIYRVPGNRAHVDLLFHKFDEDATVSIRELDIPVNAVATALKDFFSKRLPPLIPANTMDDLTNIANIDEKRNRLLALRELLQKLPPVNFCILKFVFQHFVKISENSRLNSMDSKNLAICWWPTLLPFEFNDMMMFERMRPHLEESVQMMIDQYKLLYCDESEDVIV